MDRADIKGYFTEEYLSALILHNRYKRFGLPFSGGWAEQPEYLMEVIEVFEIVYAQYQAKQTQKAQKKAGMSGNRR